MGQLSHDSLGQVIRDWVGQFCATEWVSLKVIEQAEINVGKNSRKMNRIFLL
ncbi:MAG: hypothetical protein AB8G05_09600 [Oligoflexales bacterium]